MEKDRKQNESRVGHGSTYKAVSRGRKVHPTKQFISSALLVVLCFIVGLGGGFLAHKLSETTTINHFGAKDGNAIVSEGEENIAAVANKVGPSVVSIITKGTSQTFFGTQANTGAGSGMILSKSGYILTNKHVVSGSSSISVMTSDGTEYSNVKLIGTDPLNDLAFLKVTGAKNFVPVTLGDSSSVRIGQNVTAIGNSLGEYQNTVTSGIISGVGRPVTAQSEDNQVESLTDLLQTDAAINPGNSGGPLVNLAGQIIGINTAVAQGAQGIGFAIPINSAKGLIKTLLRDGKVAKGYLGVRYVGLTPQLAKKYKLSVTRGAYITSDDNTNSVVEGSPADQAGIKDGDVITKVGDLEVGAKGSLSSLVSEYSVGDKVKLTLLRDGHNRTVTVTLVEYSSN